MKGYHEMAIAVVLAAGSGSRMHTDIPKQYMKLAGREVLYYSLHTFQEYTEISEIVLVTRAVDSVYCRTEIAERYNLSKVSAICAGGEERYDSVYNGLQEIRERAAGDIVIIHDGARPFVTSDMIEESIAAAKKYGACTVGVPVKDTIKIVDEEGFGVDTPERSSLYQIQTPQTFQYDLLMAAYELMLEGRSHREDKITRKTGAFSAMNHKITDDTMLVEQYKGVRCKMVPGAYENIKITTPEDMEIAQKFAEKFFRKF